MAIETLKYPTEEAMKGYIKSFRVAAIRDEDPLRRLRQRLTQTKGTKSNETLVVTIDKKSANETTTIKVRFNGYNVMDGLSNQEISNKIAQWITGCRRTGWVIESVDDHYVNIVKYKPVKGSSYIELPKKTE